MTGAAGRGWGLDDLEELAADRDEAADEPPGGGEGEDSPVKISLDGGDLVALTVDTLATLSENVRDGSPSDWRQYWNVDSHHHPQEPTPENACCDVLLSDLKLKMVGWALRYNPRVMTPMTSGRTFGSPAAAPILVCNSPRWPRSFPIEIEV